MVKSNLVQVPGDGRKPLKKIRYAISKLSPFSKAYSKTGLLIQGLEIYYKPYSTYLIFFVIKEDKVIVTRLNDWQSVIKRICSINLEIS